MQKENPNKDLMKYASLTFQFLLAIGLGVYLGFKTDEWLKISFPLLVWLFPLVIIVGTIIKIITDTGKK